MKTSSSRRRTSKKLPALLAFTCALLVGCASAPTVQSLAELETAGRRALRSAGLRAETVAGPRGDLRVFESAGRAGSTLVLLHGSGTQAGDWHQVVPALKKRHSLLVLDLLGHGESEPREGAFSVADLVAGVESVLDARRPREKVTLIGNSLGGWVALAYAWKHPERVERVIGISSSGLYAPLKVPLMPKDREEARRVVEAVRGRYADPVSDATLDELVARVQAGALPRLVAGLRAEDFLEGKVATIRVPVDLLWGEEDGVLPPAYGQRLASLLPMARFHSLPRCGHIPQLYCGPATAQRLLEILEMAPAPYVAPAP